MRKDGTLVKDIDLFTLLIPFIMDKTYDAQNLVKQEIDPDPIRQFISLHRNLIPSLTHLSVLVYAYLASLKKHPQLNRFVVNSRLYQRNSISVSFVTLKRGADKTNEQTVVKIKFSEDDDLTSVSNKIHDEIEKNINSLYSNNTDALMKAVAKFSFLVRPIVAVIKWLDKHSLLPQSIIEASPFHTSLFITNLYSIRTNYIYHHLYEFGTTGVFVAMGKPEKKLMKAGDEIVEKKHIPLGITLDERICSGHEFAMFFTDMNRYLSNPGLLLAD